MLLKCVPSKSVSATPYELWYSKRSSLDHLYPWILAGYVHDPTHKHRKLGLRATNMVLIRYPEHSKGYTMLGNI